MSGVADVVLQMQSAGLPQLPPNHPLLDGKFHRFGPGKKGWYVLRELTLNSGLVVVTGAFGWFQGEERNTVPVRVDCEAMSEEDRAHYVQKQRDQERREAEKRDEGARLAANRAIDQWQKAEHVPIEHPYLVRKQITAERVRVSPKGLLLVPMARGGKLVGVQKIDQSGGKLYSKDMDAIGACCVLGSLAAAPIIAVGEGYATCRTVRMAVAEFSDLPVVVAFTAGGIMAVAQWLRRTYPAAHLLFLADDDFLLEQRFSERLREDYAVDAAPIDGLTHSIGSAMGEVEVTAAWRKDAQGIEFIYADVRRGASMRHFTFRNAGVASCNEALKAVGNGSIAKPLFAARGERKLTDWNDLHVEEGLEAVTSQLVFHALAAKQPNNALTLQETPALESASEDRPAPQQVEEIPAQQPESSPSSDFVDPPLPLDAKQPPDGADSSLPAHFDDVPPPEMGDFSETGDPYGQGEGGAVVGQKEKPKKVYGRDHWDQVEYVLKNFILIYGEDLVWDKTQHMLMKISAMKTIIQNSDVMKFWGGPARQWVLKKNIVFDPQETPSPAASGANATVNLFRGWRMVPIRGDCLQIMTLLLHLCDGDHDLMTWVLRWLAYPLRHRGAKMETSIIMHGDEGSGKNVFFEKVVKRIYGEYGYVIGNAQLESQFNDWASMKLFMVADEVVTRSELKHMKGKLKYLVSGDSIIINPKGLPEHSEANHMNFVFLSNELQPLALDKTDRRYLVIWTPPALTKEFYRDVAATFDQGAIEAFYHHLLYEVDMGDFDEHTKPIYTSAKDDLIEKSLTPAERFYRDWSKGFLPLPFITCGATQLYEAYKAWCEKSGESRYISQTIFSPTVLRYAGADLEKKVIKYEYGSVVKQRNVFVAGQKPADKTLSDWVADASALFETSLKAYRSNRSQPDVEA